MDIRRSSPHPPPLRHVRRRLFTAALAVLVAAAGLVAATASAASADTDEIVELPSRAETAAQALRYQVALQNGGCPPRPMHPEFSDVATDHELSFQIGCAAYRGLVGGYPDGTFRPDIAVTEWERDVIFDRAGLECPSGWTHEGPGQCSHPGYSTHGMCEAHRLTGGQDCDNLRTSSSTRTRTAGGTFRIPTAADHPRYGIGHLWCGTSTEGQCAGEIRPEPSGPGCLRTDFACTTPEIENYLDLIPGRWPVGTCFYQDGDRNQRICNVKVD